MSTKPFAIALAALIVFILIGCSGSFSYSSAQGKTIAPKGSFYSYKVPTGFFIENSTGVPGSFGRQYETGVNYPLGVAVVRVSEQIIVPPTSVAAVEQAFITQASHWSNPATAWHHLTVARNPALAYRLSGISNDGYHEESQEYVTFKGAKLVYVSCLWERSGDKDRALAGCGQVLKSLHIG